MFRNLFRSRRSYRTARPRRRPSCRLALETLESRCCPTLSLTPDGVAAGFGISIFAVDFPHSAQLNGEGGPVGIAFPASGGVLVSDFPGNVRLFANDIDGQSADWFPPAQNYGGNNALGLAISGGNIYMTQENAGKVVQINPDGTFNQEIYSSPGSALVGIVTNPLNGHLFVADQNHNRVLDVDPSTGTAAVFANPSFPDGLTISSDGAVLYVAADAAGSNSHILGYDTTTQQVVFDSGAINGADGVSIGAGSLAGKILVNTNFGQVWEVDLASPSNRTLIASNGSRGDFVTDDPSGASTLVTQTDRIVRLIFPTGGGGGGVSVGAALNAALDHQQGAVALTEADSPLSRSPAHGLSLPQVKGAQTLLPREYTALAASSGSTSTSGAPQAAPLAVSASDSAATLGTDSVPINLTPTPLLPNGSANLAGDSSSNSSGWSAFQAGLLGPNARASHTPELSGSRDQSPTVHQALDQLFADLGNGGAVDPRATDLAQTAAT